MNTKENVLGMQHIGIPAKDFHETVKFYKQLGFETAWLAEDRDCIFLKLQDIMLEVYGVGDEAAMCYGAVDHISLNVKNVEELYAQAQDEEYKIVSDGLQTLPFWEKGVKFFTIEGPNKEKIEFNEYL